jgi:thiol-disulfide isomerase/thioredoxin
MVAKRSTKTGKVVPYVDVRSPKDVPKFESMVSMGPTLVLVYADWCGHCQRFKSNMWNEVAKSENRNMNVAAVHYDMVDKTSMKNANIEGYPTLFEVKSPKAKTPVPVPTPTSKEELETIVNSAPNEAIANSAPNENMMRSERIQTGSFEAQKNTFVPEEAESLPPNLEEMTAPPAKPQATAVQGGGSLFETLLKVSADSAHAIVLAGSAIEISKRLKKRRSATKRRRSFKKQTRRR